jgi:hypothetical protein
MAWVGASGPSVSLLDPQEVSRARLSLNEKSDPSLSMSNADRLTRSAFAIDNGGFGHLVLYGTGRSRPYSPRWPGALAPLDGAPVEALPAAMI